MEVTLNEKEIGILREEISGTSRKFTT